MKMLILGAVLALTAGASPVLAQSSTNSDFPGTNPVGFRDANDRLVRLQGALAIEARRDGYQPGAGFGGASGFGQPAAVGNQITVINQVSCSAEGTAVVTCTGGTASANNNTQDNSGTVTSRNNVRDNVFNSTQNNNEGTPPSSGNE